jgi:hypothetical protein
MTKTIVTLALDSATAFETARSIHNGRVLNAAEITSDAEAFGLSGERTGTRLPMSSEQAEGLMDRDGMVTVVVLLNQENYFERIITSASNSPTATTHTPEAYAHDAAFSFGEPSEASAEILGVRGSDFIVSYTTHVRESLDD